ncbi:hypothetical protein DCAR_0519113 [Daucus carota subsp. sativus]|uniref:Uncharacterized protein n=1 Tax=Daucus carota subsp. sativus TaxID=79200 RepID=A0A164XQK9_DAUCS|nr:hypothetical protein DCAR_0519113 [Daucus carota subsp. sativus]
MTSWKHQLLILCLLAFIVSAQASRLPKASWEQMMPKKLPTPSSAPSKGTNSVATATISSSESKQKLRSADKNV